jgi:hypothetical protein
MRQTLPSPEPLHECLTKLKQIIYIELFRIVGKLVSILCLYDMCLFNASVLANAAGQNLHTCGR